jgi:hypothetical protein
MKQLIKSAVVVATVAVTLGGVAAEAATFIGDTTGGSTFNRPLTNASSPPVSLSAVGTDVRFNSQVFNVDTMGIYTAEVLAAGTDFDPFFILYQNSFNPLNQLNNALIADDDDGVGFLAGIGIANPDNIVLSPGTNYFLVTTGFNNADFGTFTNEILGPGNITFAPVPFEFEASLGLIALGGMFGGYAFNKKRKASKKLSA